ncbi:transglycosylase family protein [Streptomyces sp. SP2-10]|uniref:LysM peptidoglycan-binding domain-containing protein n=1 Tax=Streptomyces sp. SP2-10 TaxID=2873385 RepID=UPI001CA6EBD8|nr:transglycosylase family protein [Streptomyces sp. SP2-10]MBY8844559.1 transglycosylase family protein [Streptomyces sp. SP2-10]
MLSGNGRHRRPRQAPALLVAAGVTGSAIAIPLLGAASANAADGTTWDKVAECESGGSWSADTGNGYYGGLQISQDDWGRYGGTQYADSADQASRQQQISVAEKILADRGTTPWATCALLSGLTEDSGSADVDTGVGGSEDGDGSGNSQEQNDNNGKSDTSDTSDSSGLPDSSPSTGTGADGDADSGSHAGSSSDKNGKSTPKPSKDADKGADSTETNTPKSDKSPSQDTGTPRETGSTPAATPDTATEDNAQQAAGSWSLVDTGTLGNGGRHRGASADESITSGQNATSAGRHASREPGTYTVREGDSLVSIADSLEVDGGWHALYARNEKAIGSDPNRIAAGQTLEVGGETGGK